MTTLIPTPRRGAIVLIVALLTACQLFAPAYNADIGNRTNEAYMATGQLLSEAEFGKFQTADTFPATVDRYANIDALLATASASAGVLPTAAKPAERARALLVRQIEGCRARMKTLAKIHQREGIAPAAGLTADARVACDLAARAANAMKPQ